MKTSVKIAALRRTIKRIEEDRSFFEARIKDYTPDQKELAIRTNNQALESARAEIQKLLTES